MTKKQYWRNLLGENVLDEILYYNPNLRDYLKEEKFEAKKEIGKNSFSLWGGLFKRSEWRRQIYRQVEKRKLYFAEFYQIFLIQGIEELNRQIREIKKYTGQMICTDFTDELASRLQNIALRTLIAEMHRFKKRGMIKGADSKEQYQDFCKRCGSKEFFITLQIHIRLCFDVFENA